MYALAKAKDELANYLSNVLNVDKEKVLNSIEYPTKEQIADLALPLPSVTKKFDIEIKGEYNGRLIKEVWKDGLFINARLNEKELLKEIFTNFSENYGIIKTERPLRIVVEHTSANPIHPLHIGHLRNAILGDTLAKMLKARGHEVNVRFYVNDSGRQVALLIYGLSKLGYPDPPSEEKKDQWLGLIYAMTNVILEIKKINEELKSTTNDSEYKEKIARRDELLISASELSKRNQEYFNKLSDQIMNDKDPEGEISKIIEKYEKGEEDIKKIVRKYVDFALEGFKESLEKLHIMFDNFDYESDLLWNNDVKLVLDFALTSVAKINYKGTAALDLQNYIDDDIRKEIRIPKGLEIPPLVLMRSDGTTLYTVRDIAYTIYKFRQFNADEVINVIAEQQSVPQMQLRAALYILGWKKFAINLIHFSYGMVTLQGMKMSGRLGKYISLDEVYDKVAEVVKAKIEEKKGILENLNEIVNSAIRYAIISVSANKPVSFDVKRVANFEENSGPYLQYTYARAYNILSKSTENLDISKIDENELKNEKRTLLLMIAKFPDIFINSVDHLQPEVLTVFLRGLADVFNSWYDKERVLQEPDESKRITRLFIVKGVETVLRNGLNTLGIASLTRM
ncbi:arginyl-tRNA synthetase [Acidianus hospitalis W1]|uniref:Arginine--tRNA ligase n=1 Tax=Acidianus hospitalis (strain W1) TaxID=933801 RepID=F4B4N2_ACIHW|nr:arginine--tRNA ligase [Acidianus hospitalis]AEE94262.1 arginyl-tRNA synthetase [Acidianus hospitalis W1]